MSKIPPYGSELFHLQKQGLKPATTIFLWIGNSAWKKAKESVHLRPVSTLLIPPWFCPSTYFWPVNDCRVLIVDTGYAEDNYLNDIAYCLYQGGADVVMCLTHDKNLIVFHKE